MAITDIVEVTITVQDSIPSVANFGSIAVFAYHTNYVGFRTYNASPSGLAAMVTDGFATNDPAYLAVSAIAAQNPGVPQVKVFARTAENQQQIDLDFTSQGEGFVHTFDVSNGGSFTTCSYTEQAGDTDTDIATALHTEANAVDGVSSTDNADGTISLSPTNTGERVYLKNIVRQITVDDASADAGIDTDLTAAVVEDPDFFGVILDSNCASEIEAAASWCESNKKMLLGNCMDSDIVGSGSADVASALSSSSYHFSAVMFSRDPQGYGNAALMSRQFSRSPGSSTWAFKTLSGVQADALTATELNNARGKNALTYVNTKGIKHTFDGKAASGRFLDVTRGIEWLHANLEADVFTVIANAEKIPYTNLGVSQIEAVVRKRLSIAQNTNGLLAPGWTVSVPNVADVSTTDKGNRLLPDVEFSAELAGAVHKVQIDGSVQV